MPPFRAAQIVGARFAFFVLLAHVEDRLNQGDGVFENGLKNRPLPSEETSPPHRYVIAGLNIFD